MDNSHGIKFSLWLKYFTTLIMHSKFQPLVFNTFWEDDFSTFSPYKSMGTQIWPCHKRSNVILGFGKPWVLMLYTNIQPQSFLVLKKKKIKKCFYHVWAWWPSCSMVQNHLNKLTIPLWQKVPCEILWQGHITPEDKISIVTKRVW